MFKYVQMVLPEKNVFCDEILLVWAAVPLFNSYNNKEFTCKSSLTLFCAESSGKKIGWSTIFHKLKSVVIAKIAQNNSQVSAGGMTEITVKPGQDSIHELIIWKVNPFVADIKLHSNDQWIFYCNFRYTMKWKIFQCMDEISI